MSRQVWSNSSFRSTWMRRALHMMERRAPMGHGYLAPELIAYAVYERRFGENSFT
ncbi:hypothetical protein ACN28E_10410 [Archangium lansingense]|uniref:hypothetical protein n=1 Tax=Archangium lansingense TaxID=2995310 RepID=UPI003B828113